MLKLLGVTSTAAAVLGALAEERMPMWVNDEGMSHEYGADSVNGVVETTISLDAYTTVLSDTCQLHLRGYNQGTEPLIRVNAGDVLAMHFENNLEPDPHFVHNPEWMNTFRLFNTSNIHTHGLHISPNNPQDNSLLEIPINGQSTWDYRFKVGDQSQQTPGLHWYHAHVHGATTNHVAAGSTAILRVNEDPSRTPDWVKAMPEVNVMMRYLTVATFNRMSQTHANAETPYVDDLWENSITDGCDANMLFINGAINPTLNVIANEWTRVGLVLAGPSAVFMVQIDPRCEFWTMALDGIFLERPVLQSKDGENHPIPLSAGNRYEFAMRCDQPVSNDPYTFQIESNPSVTTCVPNPATPETNARPCQTFKENNLYQFGNSPQQKDAEVFKVMVHPSDLAQTTPPSTGPHTGEWFDLAYIRPSYLTDLTTSETRVAVSTVNMWNVGPKGFEINGRKFPDVSLFGDDGIDYHNEAMWHYPLGEVSEIMLTSSYNANAHPYHQHIVPFQIQPLVDKIGQSLSEVYGFDMSRQWMDNLLVPGNGVVHVRQVPDFAGTQIIHCHFLDHEDTGMMAYGIVANTKCGYGANVCCITGGASCGVDDLAIPIAQESEWSSVTACVCAFDPHCCDTNWDAQCVAEAQDSPCNLQCS